MLGLGVGGIAEDEHLHLVELVHPDDASGVLAVGASLAAEARGPAGIAQREGTRREDLIAVQASQGDLGRAHEVHVVRLDPIDVLRRLAKKSRALHRPGRDKHRRDDGDEAVAGRLRHRQVEQRDLQQSTRSHEVVEARARDLGRAFDVDRTQHLAEFEVITRRKTLRGEVARSPHDLKDREVRLAPDGRAHVDDVGELKPGRIEGAGRLSCGGIGGLHSVGEIACLRHEGIKFGLGGRIPLLHRTLKGPDALGELLLLGTEIVVRHLLGPALNIERCEPIDQGDVLTATALRLAQVVGGFPEETRIDHGTRLEVAVGRPTRLPLSAATARRPD